MVFSLYLSIRGFRKCPGKFCMGSWKVLDFFVSKTLGTLNLVEYAVIHDDW